MRWLIVGLVVGTGASALASSHHVPWGTDRNALVAELDRRGFMVDWVEKRDGKLFLRLSPLERKDPGPVISSLSPAGHATVKAAIDRWVDMAWTPEKDAAFKLLLSERLDR